MCYLCFAGVFLNKRWDWSRTEVLDCSSEKNTFELPPTSPRLKQLPLEWAATHGEKQSLVSLHGEYTTSHTLELQLCQDGFGQGLTSSPALSRWTLLCGTPNTGHPPQLTRCPSSLHEWKEAEEIAGTSEEKWDFVVIALKCLEPSEVSAGGFKKHSTFPLSRRLKPEGKDIPCWENQSLHLLFLSVLTIISSYRKAKSCQGWLIILTIKQNQKNK